MSKFNAFIILSLIIMTTTSINSQDLTNNSDSAAKANEILNQARNVVYKDDKSRNIKSVFLSLSGSSYDKTISFMDKSNPRIVENRLTVKNEYSVEFPSFAKIVRKADMKDSERGVQLNLEMTTIVNGEQVNRHTETIINGQKMEMGSIPQFEEMFNTGTAPAKLLSGEPQKSPRSIADGEIQTTLFPILLFDFIGNAPVFNYAGKTESGGKKADVLEVQAENSSTGATRQTIRYFFDCESHLLLLITGEYVSDGVEKSVSTYFSGHRLIGGLMIPTKIKEESKIISKKPLEVMGMKITGSEHNKITELEIGNFETGTKFPAKLFEIKK